MKQVFCTVAASSKLNNVKLLMDSVALHFPKMQRVVYVLDGEEEFVQDGCVYRPAETFYKDKEEFVRFAFAYPEEDFVQVVLAYAAQALLKEGYAEVTLSHWSVQFTRAVALLETMCEPDTVVYLVDKKEKLQQEKNARLLANRDPWFTSPVFKFTKGECTASFLQFCCKKFDFLAQNRIMTHKALGFAGTQLDAQPIFYQYWYVHARYYGLNISAENIFNLNFNSSDTTKLPLYYFGGIIAHEKNLHRSVLCLPEENQYKITREEFRESLLLEAFSYEALELFEQYKRQAAALNYNKPYKFDYFSNGVQVHELLRIYYSFNAFLRDNCGKNPFEKFELFCCENVVVGDTNLILYNAMMDMLYKMRPDLQGTFPDRLAANRLAFLHWFLEYAVDEYEIPEAYVQPVQASLQAYRERLQQAAAARGFAQKVADRIKRQMGNRVEYPANNFNDNPLQHGVNLVGFMRGDFGLGAAGRILAASLEAAGVPFTIVNFEPLDSGHTFTDHSWDHKITNQFPYDTNILVINTPGVLAFKGEAAPKVFEERYNIAFWYWELPEFPFAWVPCFDAVDEVWTSSEFTAESFRPHTDKPIHVVPCCVEVEEVAPLTRADFGLEEDAFTFLMMYDIHSFRDRKNPEGTLRAFVSKFENNPKVQLVIKVSAAEPWALQEDFIQEAQSYSNVKILVGSYPRAKINALIKCCDAFVSLHRSEGFGLGPAEAMYLGKPAIVTNWSGNTQYMTKDNCCPVEYTIVEIRDNHVEYRRGRHWAEPSVENAAEYMQRLVEDPAYYKAVAAAGQKTIQEQFSAKATGDIAAQRLLELGRL